MFTGRQYPGCRDDKYLYCQQVLPSGNFLCRFFVRQGSIAAYFHNTFIQQPGRQKISVNKMEETWYYNNGRL